MGARGSPLTFPPCVIESLLRCFRMAGRPMPSSAGQTANKEGALEVSAAPPKTKHRLWAPDAELSSAVYRPLRRAERGSYAR